MSDQKAKEFYEAWAAHNAFTETFDLDSGWNKEGMTKFAEAYALTRESSELSALRAQLTVAKAENEQLTYFKTLATKHYDEYKAERETLIATLEAAEAKNAELEAQRQPSQSVSEEQLQKAAEEIVTFLMVCAGTGFEYYKRHILDFLRTTLGETK
jgi:hypothetical protein